MPTSSVNTRDVDLRPVAATLRDVWPDALWDTAVPGHGAFHGVLTVGDEVVRVAFGSGHHARAAAEAANLEAFGRLGLPVALPHVVRGVVSTGSWSAVSTSRVAGEPMVAGDWSAARRVYLPLLERLRAVPVADASARLLRPVRSWCGGESWAADARETIRLLPTPRVRDRAREVVAAVAETEAGVAASVIHGDLSPYNLLVEGNDAGMIDLDHGAVGDPAIDLIWLVGMYSVRDLQRDIPAEELRRAAVHRAAAPLQLASAALAIGDAKPAAHALHTFAARVG